MDYNSILIQVEFLLQFKGILPNYLNDLNWFIVIDDLIFFLKSSALLCLATIDQISDYFDGDNLYYSFLILY
jgi:hypothetical protein